ncbi:MULTISPECIES: XVIPCD domain-containing protein [Stenotrophomonas]|uniref:XVIPCD domain-containing protein n=1 Tax=Stenotrophomonas TaxID=40323 RepID=UPI000D54283E|nr:MULTISPECIES: XVIPCD domain-containing protein [Stenotrophomonas]AWH31787.1 hypothetical protein C1930_02315 [Stenotrophomonas sp. SAU14A_NAIMI4_8]
MQPTAERYTVTIHAAAPGTPRHGKREGHEIVLNDSQVGHMYFSLDRPGALDEEGKKLAPLSFGLTRDVGADGSSHGKVELHDVRIYQNPRFERTIEISKEQYEKLKQFGESPAKHGFDMDNYNLITNACSDFTWNALNHAGLHPVGAAGPIKNYEGSIKVLDNIPAINAIPQQIKGSELDAVKWNEMPKQSFGQWWISQHGEPAQNANPLDGTPADPSHADHARLNQLHTQVAATGAFGDELGNVSASLLALSHQNGFARVDEVVVGERRGDAAPNLFIVQGDRADPAHLRASLPADVAAQTPVAASFERVEQLAQAQPQRDAQRLQEDQQLQQSQGPRMA